MSAVPSNPNSISIPVSPEVAASFMALSEANRELLRRIVRNRIEKAVRGSDQEFFNLMDQTAKEAEERGLTPEALQRILDEV